MMLDDYLERLRTGLKRLPAHERDAVVEEVRDHLQDKAADLHDAEAGLDHMEALRRAIDDFGPAEEVAAAYDEQTGELRRPGGEVLRVTRAVGRGAGRAAVGVGRVAGAGAKAVVRVVGAIAVTALVAASVVAVVALVFADEWIPFIEDQIDENRRETLYHRHLDGGAGAGAGNDGNTTDTFYVPAGLERLSLTFWAAPEAGCVSLTLVAPDGVEAYASGPVCDDRHQETTLPPASGVWSVRVTDDGYAGDGAVSVSYRGVDPDA